LILSIAVLLGSSVRAQSDSTNSVPLISNVENEIAHLRQAYAYLESGDHDYKGHRAKALHAIGAACKSLGLPTKGEGKNKEAQAYSDSLLKAARANLVTVESLAQAAHQDKLLEHVHTALHEIDLALEVAAGETPKKK